MKLLLPFFRRRNVKIMLFYNNRVGLGCGFVCDLLTSQKREAISCCVTTRVRTMWLTGDG